jgi:hypothetical protein
MNVCANRGFHSDVACIIKGGTLCGIWLTCTQACIKVLGHTSMVHASIGMDSLYSKACCNLFYTCTVINSCVHLASVLLFQISSFFIYVHSEHKNSMHAHTHTHMHALTTHSATSVHRLPNMVGLCLVHGGLPAVRNRDRAHFGVFRCRVLSKYSKKFA